MRIVHVEDYFDPSAGYQINELLVASMEFEDEVFLITSDDMTPFHKKVDLKKDKEYEKNTGVKIIRLKATYKLSSRVILKGIKEHLEKLKPNVVFMHGIGDFKDLLLWNKKQEFKIVRDCHMSWVASKNKFRYLYYFLYRILFASIINSTNKYDMIYALGVEEYEYLKKIGISDNKIDFLYHGYNDSYMYFDKIEREKIRRKYNLSEEDIIISYIGKFNFIKRPDIIADIIELIDPEFIVDNKVKLLFIGSKDEKYMNEFNKKIEKIKNKIPIIQDEWKPFNELYKYFSASDICVFPKETTLSSIHAQVCGCSVVMENHKSNAERVLNKGHLYQTNNISHAASIIKNIIMNKEYKDNYENIALLKDREYKNQIKKFMLQVTKDK